MLSLPPTCKIILSLAAVWQVVVEFVVRRGPKSAAAGEGFQPHQAFVRATHVATGVAAAFRAKVAASSPWVQNDFEYLSNAQGALLASATIYAGGRHVA